MQYLLEEHAQIYLYIGIDIATVISIFIPRQIDHHHRVLKETVIQYFFFFLIRKDNECWKNQSKSLSNESDKWSRDYGDTLFL